MATKHAGSSSFTFGAVATNDYYPTNGFLSSSDTTVSPVLTSSDLRNTTIVTIDALWVLTNTDGAVWTLKDAAGVTLHTWTIGATTPVGHVIQVGMTVPGRGGFTMASDDANTVGLCLYTPEMNIP